jgi:DNA-binding SARP family transcriptional activator
VLVERLVLRTLGGLSLENGGRPIVGAAAQRGRLALLSVIAAAGDRGISRDLLLALFWSESDNERARGALKQALYSLRRDVGERELTLGTSELRLNPAVITSDIGEFEDALKGGLLERAVELYKGPFLDGIYLHDAPEFERWADRERERLASRFRTALGGLARAAAMSGDTAAAVAWWRRLAVADPLSASIAVSLMEALATSGDSASALRHADLYTALVRQDLGAAADQSVSALAEHIRTIDEEALTARGRTDRSDVGVPSSAESEAVQGMPLREHSASRRRRLLIGAGVVTAAVVIGGSFALLQASRRPLDEHRVVLTIGSRSTRGGERDPLTALLRNRLTDAIVETQLATVVPVPREIRDGLLASELTPERTRSFARAANARYVVATTYEINGDSVRVSAQIVDAAAHQLPVPIESVRGTRAMPERIVAELRTRVLAALTARIDPTLQNWAFAAAMPATYEAVRELRLGIDAFAADDLSQATRHFRLAAALDSNSATPLVWAAYGWAHSSQGVQWGTPGFARSDSIIKALEASRRQLGRWDAALLEEVKAFIIGDLALAHIASHRVMQVVPKSEWVIMLAYDAYNVGRAREAVRLLREAGPKNGWIGGWGSRETTLQLSFHFLHDYESQLDFARSVLLREPGNTGWLQIEVSALAALGRATEVEKRCIESQRIGASVVCEQGIVELRGHGNAEAARRLFWLRDRYEANPDSETTRSPLEIAAELAWDGFVAAADSVARANPLRGPPTDDELSTLRTIAVALGDRTTGELLRRELDSLARVASPWHREELSFRRAELAGWLGDRDDAVYWLTRAFREGLRHRSFIHWYPPFIKLRGYAPFEALLRPVDDAEKIPPL